MNRFDWVYGENVLTQAQTVRFADEIGKSPVIASLLAMRGITDSAEFKKFNNKSPADLHSPFLMKDMDKAVERIRTALENGEQITVYGDYDVDGITSVAALTLYLRSLGGNVDYYIPDRLDEGYGINLSALCSLFEGGTTLVITVDTGITAHEEIESAKYMGLDVIVTDHHRCKDTIPSCCAVINPTRPDCDYPYKKLAGVGVVFKLLCALENGNHQKILDLYGDIVALGTVADVVDLTGENRIIVDLGLKNLQNTSNIGLRAIIEATGANKSPITVSGIGYGIAPKINAAGRIGDAGCGVNLLLVENEREADEISLSLIEENRHRQELEKQIFTEAVNKIDSDPSFEQKAVLVVWGKGWHHGVIGIVASKISEKYSKPCILITIDDNLAKGSGRSTHGFNLFEAMSSFPDIFIKYGGHALAAGLTLYTENLKELDKCMNEYAKSIIPPEGKKPALNIDFELPVRFVNNISAGELELLEPCGTGNPTPEFSMCECKIINAKQLSDGKHLRLVLEKEGKRIDAIGFGMGKDFDLLIPGDYIDIAGCMTLNVWNGTARVQFVLHDLRYTPSHEVTDPIPVREDFAAVYTFIRRRSNNGFLQVNKEFFLRKLKLESSAVFDEKKLLVCLDIFTEKGLLHYLDNEGSYHIYLNKTDHKVDLESSEILKKLKSEKGV